MLGGLIIDNFAGGGGASTGIEMAIGRSPDVAINHDAEAVSMHAANHPSTLHLCQNVWKADPREVVRQASAKRCTEEGRPFEVLPVELAWFSPDCKHFSKAKGSKPVEKGIRDLAWVVVHWARLVKPRVIMLENVEEFRDWGPLIETADGRLVPCPLSKGLTFKRWVRELKRAGARRVEWRELRACNHKTPTIRKRLYVIARFDDLPIVWPEATNAKEGADGLAPWRTAAECIDWHLPCPSIFNRKRALAENTMRRIARGVMRYVVNAKKPFIVGVGGRMGQSPERPVDAPMQTITAKGDSAVVQPVVVGIDNKSNGDRDAWPLGEPLRTTTVENRFAVAQPFISRVDQTSAADRNGIAPVEDPLRTVHSANGFALIAPLTHHDPERGQSPDEPLRTITAAHRGEQALIAAHVTKFRAGSDGHPVDEPLHTVTANSFKKRPGGAAPLGIVGALLAPRYTEREGQAPRARPVDEPIASIVPTGNEGSLAVAFTAGAGGPTYGGKPTALDRPAKTQATENHQALVTAFLAQHNTGCEGRPAEEPVSTIVGKGCTQGVVTAKAAALHHAYSSNTAGGNGDPEAPAKTITTGGHHAVVECDLSAEDLAGAERVAAFMVKYYGAAEHGQSVAEPLHSATSKPRFGLVAVCGLPIVDIGLRMLTPRELYRAQGFPERYIIDRGADGEPLTKTAQVRMVGNSVCPPVAEALVRANLVDIAADVRAAD